MASSDVPLWINGERRSASDKGTFEVHNPLSKQVVVTSASATSQDCSDAVEAAGKAFDSWEHISAAQKRAILLKAADLIVTEKYKDKFTKAMRDEMAASDTWVTANIALSRVGILEAASQATQIKGESFPSSASAGGLVIVQRRAHGTILSIAPWNAPIVLTCRAILIPLICGNTVVLKSSELSPRSQEIVVELMHEAGLPPGVLNYISVARDKSPILTAELIGHHLIRHVNFTGSDRVGRIIAGEAAKYLKPCVLELGGKAPAVILDDADTEAAARSITSGALIHSGQVCMSTERVIVQRGASSSLLSSLKTHFSRIRAGDPLADPSAKLSSLISETAAEGVIAMLREAQEQGADVLVGDMNREGSVVQPHVILGVKPGMRAFDRESFGPVVGVTVVDTVDEAIELANATEYSLMASLWTRDINRALDIGPRIRAGLVSINGSTVHSEPAIGNAGLGGATGYGRFDVDNFSYKRAIIIHPAQAKYPIVDSP